MITDYQIPEPLLFNPVKHHLGFIKEFVGMSIDTPGFDAHKLIRELKHIGTSVMDVYKGSLSVKDISAESLNYLDLKGKSGFEDYSSWIGNKEDSFHIITLSDDSQWAFKFHNNHQRFVHFFPARNSQHTFRVKANTLKSALMYNIIIGKDLVTGDDLNRVRQLLGLSPVKDSIETEAILEMIEILRD
jgi:hypothetical protein